MSEDVDDTRSVVSLRTVVDPPRVDDLRIDAADTQRVVLLLAGHKSIESQAAGRWRRAEHRPGSLSLTAPGRDTRLRWQATGREPVRTLHLTVPGPMVRSVSAQVWPENPATPVLDTLSDDDAVTAGLLRAMWRARSRPGSALYTQSAAQFLLVHLLTRYGSLPAPPPPTGREDRRMVRVTGHMVERLAEPLDLAELAGVAGLSPFHFLRVFTAHFGRTPIRYLSDLRLETARRLLRTTTSSMTEIAYTCGYSSPGHFSTVFRRNTGVTPSRYRADHRR